MNLQQLEYIVAVDKFRHFVTASEHCFVTQPTLSMMIKKLEEELEVVIFDRSKQPVVPTSAGALVIRQAKKILSEASRMKEILADEKEKLSGELRIAVIPTLAPYMLPKFTAEFSKRFPKVDLFITEMITEEMVKRIESGELDAGILVTPLHREGIKEEVLFYERFFAYVSDHEKVSKKKYILPEDIHPDRLWLLEEGHCFRSQVMNFCELKRKSSSSHFHYEAGSIETLIKMVEMNKGITIIPELAADGLSGKQLKRIRSFRPPVPVREVSLITQKDFHRRRMKEAILDTIHDTVRIFKSQDKPIDIIEITAGE